MCVFFLFLSCSECATTQVASEISNRTCFITSFASSWSLGSRLSVFLFTNYILTIFEFWTLWNDCSAHSESFDRNEIVTSIGIYGSLRMFIAEISTMIVHISRSIQIFWFSIRHSTRTLTAENTCNFAIVTLAIDIVDIVGSVRAHGTQLCHNSQCTNWWQFYCAWFMAHDSFGVWIVRAPSCPPTRKPNSAMVELMCRLWLAIPSYSQGGTDQMVDTAESTWHRANTCDVRVYREWIVWLLLIKFQLPLMYVCVCFLHFQFGACAYWTTIAVTKFPLEMRQFHCRNAAYRSYFIIITTIMQWWKFCVLDDSYQTAGHKNRH